MKVKLTQAVKMFFGNSSLEMVYIEAIANALDAGATEIIINININAINKPDSLIIEISDNGAGFTNERYEKFSQLFDVDEGSHKGLGRLVFLCYFNQILVESHYDKNKKRIFEFTENFNGENDKIYSVSDSPSGTNFRMSEYSLQKIAKSDYLSPEHLKKMILKEFYSQFFQLKQVNKEILVKIKSNINSNEQEATLSNSDIPEFKVIELPTSTSLLDKFYLHYSIKEVHASETSLIAAISVDNRTVNIDIIADENVPFGYEMVFLLFSDYFIGKVDAARQNLTFSSSEFKEIQKIFRTEVVKLIEVNLPKIKVRNDESKKKLFNQFPHLCGYFETENVGYISRTEVIKRAQDQFFKAQKELLEATSLTDEQFDKSIEISARALTEYILFRQLTIEKLKETTNQDSETSLHKLFAAMRKDGKFEKGSFANDLYRNNSWLLDDKYMTYETVLSDREMGELISFITENETKDDDRPDIAMVFSNNPLEKRPFDVVIVELKKRGLSIEENMKVVTQLEKRARKLMQFYENQIQRIWYYGIIEFNEEVELQLSGRFTELYSSGKMYYSEIPIAISLNPVKKLPVGVFIWDLDAVVKDANARNSAFLNLIKSKFY